MTYKITLETKRLLLRPLTISDFNSVHSWASAPENTRFMFWGPNTEEQTHTFLNNVTQGKDYAVILKDSNEMIGSCGIYPNALGNTAELGWILHKDHWNQGYGTELGGALIEYGFKYLKLHRIFAECVAVNHGSRMVMEKNGMRREATYKKAFRVHLDNEWVDAFGYALLAEEYFQK